MATFLDDLLLSALRHAEMLSILDRTMGQLIDGDLNSKTKKCQVFPESIPYWDMRIKIGKSSKITAN